MEHVSPSTGTFGTIGALVRLALVLIGAMMVAAIATGSASAGTSITVTFEVKKDWSPDRANTSVSVTLSCTDGTVDPPSAQNATEETPASFDVTTSGADPTCTATESPVPTGYFASGVPEGTCEALASAGECTITNTERNFTLTLETPFSDNAEGPVVNWVFNCPDGNQSNVDTTSTDLTNAGIVITRFTPPINCTATPTPPPGYHLGPGGCTGTAGGATQETTCTQPIEPDQVSTFLVKKNWFPDRANTPVSVTLSCPGATVNPASAQNATEEAPASFTVTTLGTDPTCTATESPVPTGYVAGGSPAGTCQALASAGECTITNNERRFELTLNTPFSDNVEGPVVTWVFTCPDGIQSNVDATSTDLTSAGITVTRYTPPNTCGASIMTPAPGYHAAPGGCSGNTDGILETASCTVPMVPNDTKFTVDKDFTNDSSSQTVSITLTCTGTTAQISTTSFGGAADNDDDADEATDAEFYVRYAAAGDTCSATESPVPGQATDNSDCQAKAMVHGLDVTCTLTNSPAIVMFRVRKDWQPIDGRQVWITVTCSPGVTVTRLDPTAGQFDPADFIIQDFGAGTTCTASETTPAGYTSNQSDCANFNPNKGDCTIINRLGTAFPTFTPAPSGPPVTPGATPPTPAPGTARPTRTPRPNAGLTAFHLFSGLF